MIVLSYLITGSIMIFSLRLDTLNKSSTSSLCSQLFSNSGNAFCNISKTAGTALCGTAICNEVFPEKTIERKNVPLVPQIRYEMFNFVQSKSR